MSRLQALVFDLDDTLYAEQTYVASGFRAVAQWAEKHLGISANDGFAELWQLFLAGNRTNTFDLWLTSRNMACFEDIIKVMVRVYRDHDPQLEPHPGVKSLLARLRTRYRLGLVTDGYLEVQRKKLSALGISSYFDKLVFSDEMGRAAWKPCSRPFEVILAELEVTGPEAVYIADNPQKDFVGARKVGMRTVRVRCCGGVYSSVEPESPEHAAEMEITHLDQLEDVLSLVAG